MGDAFVASGNYCAGGAARGTRNEMSVRFRPAPAWPGPAACLDGFPHRAAWQMPCWNNPNPTRCPHAMLLCATLQATGNSDWLLQDEGTVEGRAHNSYSMVRKLILERERLPFAISTLTGGRKLALPVVAAHRLAKAKGRPLSTEAGGTSSPCRIRRARCPRPFRWNT